MAYVQPVAWRSPVLVTSCCCCCCCCCCGGGGGGGGGDGGGGGHVHTLDVAIRVDFRFLL